MAVGDWSLIQFFTAITVVAVGELGLVRLARYGRLKCARQDLRCGGCGQKLVWYGMFDAVSDVV